MKKIILTSLFFISILSSCKKEKQLEEVQLPDPNKIEDVVYGNPENVKTNEGPFKMKGLAYQYNDLEPFIDAQTMELHYSKHHLGYANKLNIAIKDTDFKNKTIEEILANLDLSNSLLRNNAGGYYNHNLYFAVLGKKRDTKPSKVFEDAIIKDFGSFNNLKKQLVENANQLFGSGWVWLIIDSKGDLKITETANQDNPLMANAEEKGIPILAIDVWEHAYYLQYKNSKKDYIDGILNVINWEKVSEKYEEITQIK